MYAAYQWIADQAPDAAAKWLDGLLDAITSLETLPKRCPIASENDLFDEEIRVLIYRMSSVYRILFTIQQDKVVILFIRHGSRDTITPGP
jgi:plasmid stabilization system protein ParE